MRTALRIAVNLARTWVRLYTSRMPTELRETRRAEIDADLWTHGRDAQEDGVPPLVTAMEIFLRTCLGVLDDLSWRFEAVQPGRSASRNGRRSMMEFSARQTRWMGFSGMVGGILWAADIAFLMRNPALNGVRAYSVTALTVLLIIGLVGFWAQQRGRMGTAGRVGIGLLITSLLSLFLLNFLGLVFAGFGGDSLVANLLGVAFALLLAPGFFLLGIGLKGAARVGSFAVAGAFVVWLVLPRLLAPFLPTAVQWGGRGDSPLGMTFFFLVAIALAFTGYSVYRQAGGTTAHRAGPSAMSA